MKDNVKEQYKAFLIANCIEDLPAVILVIAIFAVILFSPSNCAAHYDAEVVSVYDGDTMTMRVELWPGLMQTTSVRLLGIDTPEIRTKCKSEKKRALKAQHWLEQQVTGAKVTIENVKFGKFAGRVLANVLADGESLSAMALKAGHAVPYFGGKRKAWCK